MKDEDNIIMVSEADIFGWVNFTKLNLKRADLKWVNLDLCQIETPICPLWIILFTQISFVVASFWP